MKDASLGVHLRTIAVALLAFAAVYGLYQLGRACLHPKQGLDLSPPFAAGALVCQGDFRFYDDATVAAKGTQLELKGPGNGGDGILNFIYPPWVAAVYAPLTVLPFEIARYLWFLLSLGATVFSLWLLLRSTGGIEEIGDGAFLVASASLAFYFPFFYGLMTGQSNDVLLLLLCGSIYLLCSGRPLSAGVLLALAALWKPFLVLTVPFLLARREGRAALGFGLGCVCVFLVTVPMGGEAIWQDWLRQISMHNQLPQLEPRNQSLLSASLALGGAWIPPVIIRAVLQAGTVLVFGAILLKETVRGSVDYVLQFASCIAVGVLFTPKAWDHYGIFLLPLFVTLGLVSMRSAGRLWTAACVAGGFAVWGLVLQSREEYELLMSRGWGLLLVAKSAVTLLLLVVAAMSLWKRPEDGGTLRG